MPHWTAIGPGAAIRSLRSEEGASLRSARGGAFGAGGRTCSARARDGASGAEGALAPLVRGAAPLAPRAHLLRSCEGRRLRRRGRTCSARARGGASGAEGALAPLVRGTAPLAPRAHLLRSCEGRRLWRRGRTCSARARDGASGAEGALAPLVRGAAPSAPGGALAPLVRGAAPLAPRAHLLRSREGRRLRRRGRTCSARARGGAFGAEGALAFARAGAISGWQCARSRVPRPTCRSSPGRPAREFGWRGKRP